MNETLAVEGYEVLYSQNLVVIHTDYEEIFINTRMIIDKDHPIPSHLVSLKRSGPGGLINWFLSFMYVISWSVLSAGHKSSDKCEWSVLHGIQHSPAGSRPKCGDRFDVLVNVGCDNLCSSKHINLRCPHLGQRDFGPSLSTPLTFVSFALCYFFCSHFDDQTQHRNIAPEIIMRRPILISALLSTLATATSALTPAENAKLQGFTAESMEKLKADMHAYSGGTKPIVTLLARNGEIVYHDAFGKDKTKPVTKDSIFNLMSMTKPISGAAMMTFFEEGKFALDDLVSKHIPEFAELKVGTAPQKTPMTMKQLMSHSAGFAADAVAKGKTLDEGIAILKDASRTKLAFQPGTSWRYGPSVEVQGYLMQKWAGKDLAEIYDERILKPLGMVDTAFWTPVEKQSRVISSPLFGAPTKKPARLIPSYGLHSTAEDYWKFCQMILNGGEFKGKRYLKPETIKLMQTNVLNWDSGVYVNFMGGGPGVGFGLDFAVVMDPKKQKGPENMPKGSFFWGGAFGTWFWIDPTNNVTFIGLVNQMGGLSGDSTLRQASAKALYAGLSR